MEKGMVPVFKADILQAIDRYPWKLFSPFYRSLSFNRFPVHETNALLSVHSNRKSLPRHP